LKLKRENNEGIKVSILQCSRRKKFGCNFYLEFKTDSKGFYVLDNYSNIYNHRLFKHDTGSTISPIILERIKVLLPISRDIVALTKAINDEFNTNFHRRTIYYQTRKITEKDQGKPTEDATNLIELLKEDPNIKDGCLKVEIKDNKLKSVCFMTNQMKDLLSTFNDVLVLDTTHKVNRFNLPLFDIAVINNLGKTAICFLALLQDQKTSTFVWALNHFKNQMQGNPKVIFSDDDDALTKGKLFLIDISLLFYLSELFFRFS